jgi:hypothetical protein
MSCKDIHIDFKWNIDEDLYTQAMRDNWAKDRRSWPTSGNWIHAAIMTYVQEPPYELPPTIYMRLSFDGTWYPHKISNKKYTNTNHLKL